MTEFLSSIMSLLIALVIVIWQLPFIAWAWVRSKM
jgi:hypothetical protein